MVEVNVIIALVATAITLGLVSSLMRGTQRAMPRPTFPNSRARVELQARKEVGSEETVSGPLEERVIGTIADVMGPTIHLFSRAVLAGIGGVIGLAFSSALWGKRLWDPLAVLCVAVGAIGISVFVKWFFSDRNWRAAAARYRIQPAPLQSKDIDAIFQGSVRGYDLTVHRRSTDDAEAPISWIEIELDIQDILRTDLRPEADSEIDITVKDGVVTWSYPCRYKLRETEALRRVKDVVDKIGAAPSIATQQKGA